MTAGFHTDELELSSGFQPLPGEANFPPPITREVKGGTHIAPQCITVEGGDYVMVDWTTGLPRHDASGTRSVRFPHGLIHFGETFEDCARRLVSEQLGMHVENVDIIHIYSHVDETRHWHIEPLLLVAVSGTPAPPPGAAVIRNPVGPNLPSGGKWVDKAPFDFAFVNYIEKRL